jgi:hypothetical protein
MTAPKTEATPKVANPRAFEDSDLYELEPGFAWDTVEVGGIDFAYVAASNLQGIATICKGNEGKASQLFNRALRIDMPAKLDARERIKTARKNGTLPEVTGKLQADILNFDVTTIATRAPREPAKVEAEEKATYTLEEVRAMMAAGKVNFVTK